MGLNRVFFLCLFTGGTLYIDEGRPIAGKFSPTLRNLKDINPTHYTSVPIGWEMLVDAFEKDRTFSSEFFKNICVLSYGGAPMSRTVINRIKECAEFATGERITFCTGYGSTETTCVAMTVFWATEHAGLIGLPIPGVTAKLIPVDEGYEIRFKGPTVMEKYVLEKDNEKAFDDEGFFRIGDKVQFTESKPVTYQLACAGLKFGGRIGESFKLNTGTWVAPGVVRQKILEVMFPLLREAVIVGEGHSYLSVLAWPETSVSVMNLQTEIANRLKEYNFLTQGSSMVIGKVLVMKSPLSGEEVTEKGSINHRYILTSRQESIERLYSEVHDPNIVSLK